MDVLRAQARILVVVKEGSLSEIRMETRGEAGLREDVSVGKTLTRMSECLKW